MVALGFLTSWRQGMGVGNDFLKSMYTLADPAGGVMKHIEKQ